MQSATVRFRCAFNRLIKFKNLFIFHIFRLRLTRLNEEIGIEEQNTGEGDTYNDVMKDFSRYAVNQPQRLLRNSKTDQNETDT